MILAYPLTTKVSKGRDIQFRDGCPGSESSAQIGERADRVIERVLAVPGDVLLFSSGSFIRVRAVRLRA